MPHIHEKIDYAADAYIVNDGAVLLRMHEKYHRWFPPGGHVELDEDPAQAAVREAKEETGLDITLIGDAPSVIDKDEWEVMAPRFVNRHRINDTHEHIAFEYFAISKSREVNPAEGESTGNSKWFTREELDDPQYGVEDRVKHYAKAALDAAA
jgi:8-oxo-dGTP pyrophosphatase MutT (NUDIX family)